MLCRKSYMKFYNCLKDTESISIALKKIIVVHLQLSAFTPLHSPAPPQPPPPPSPASSPIWFCPCVLYSCSGKPFPTPSHYPLPSIALLNVVIPLQITCSPFSLQNVSVFKDWSITSIPSVVSSPQSYEIDKTNMYISQTGKLSCCYEAGQLVEEEGPSGWVVPGLAPCWLSKGKGLNTAVCCAPACMFAMQQVWVLARELLSSRFSCSSYLSWPSEQVALPKVMLLALFKHLKK